MFNTHSKPIDVVCEDGQARKVLEVDNGYVCWCGYGPYNRPAIEKHVNGKHVKGNNVDADKVDVFVGTCLPFTQ